MQDAATRRHRLTSSRAEALMSGSYKRWNTLAWDMRGEQPMLGQKSGVPALDHGIEHEPWVRASVWAAHPEWDDIERPGLVLYHDRSHPLFADHCAATPDGRIVPIGWGLETKAPYSPMIHLGYVRTGKLPEEYLAQVQWSLWCTGWERWVFASGDPRLEPDDPERLMYLVVSPDPAYHARIADMASEFLEGYLAHEEFKPRVYSAAKLAEMF